MRLTDKAAIVTGGTTGGPRGFVASAARMSVAGADAAGGRPILTIARTDGVSPGPGPACHDAARGRMTATGSDLTLRTTSSYGSNYQDIRMTGGDLFPLAAGFKCRGRSAGAALGVEGCCA